MYLYLFNFQHGFFGRLLTLKKNIFKTECASVVRNNQGKNILTITKRHKPL